MQATFSKWYGRVMTLGWLIFVAGAVCAQPAGLSQALVSTSLPIITNLSQLRQFGLQNPSLSHPMRLDGQVCWVNPAQKTFALMDATGGLLLQIEWLNRPLSIGDRVCLSGAGTVFKAGQVFKLGVDGLVVNDDAMHPMTEQAGAVFLSAAKVPIRVDWFNGWGQFGLIVDYEGPDLPRKGIENSELFRKSGDTNTLASGLDYCCYEGWWNNLPDFDELKPVKTGTVENFTLGVQTRDVGVGLQFNGFLNISRNGIYKFHITSDDGSRLSIGKPNVRVEILDRSKLPAPRHIFIGQMLGETEDGSWGQIEGRVTQVWNEQDGLRVELCVGSCRMEVRVQNRTDLSETALMNRLIRVTGFCLGAYNSDGIMVANLMLVPDSKLLEIVAPPNESASTNHPSGLPVLTRAADVHQLKREKAQMQYPSRVRGVVTSVDGATPGFTLQDSTGGIYVQGADPVRVGEFVEVEGVTDPGFFAPMLIPSRISRLGEGRLPEPGRPTWDQLVNGSLDAQYVEINGIVITADEAGRMQFLTRGGTITMRLVNNLSTFNFNMKQYENTLIRIRGVLIAYWNGDTHGVKVGEIQLVDPILTVENSFPADILSLPHKTAEELLQFDPQASMFQAIRMSGQIVHVGEDSCYMMLGTNGIRFVPKMPTAFHLGDTVVVAGLPQLGRGSPVLREAVAHKTGHGDLPEARPMPPNNLSAMEFDATRVSVQGVLAGAGEVGTQTVLDMQGAQNFVARLHGRNDFLKSLPVGCRLQLTGVCSFEGASQSSERDSGPFELLLDSSADVKILAQPPWWTPRRLLLTVGMLVCVLGLAVLWISQLHRKVEQRTVQLEEQIQKRQSIEQRRAMEQERTRIAQDLHDELGSGLTEISMLAAVPTPSAAPTFLPLDQIADRARNMVTALDEIVWTMNPKHDSLESLGSYLCLYANRFLKLANIACQLKGTLDLPGKTLDPIHRHEFFLAFKEALTNIVRHSGATEARLSIRMVGKRLRLCLADNGGGLEKTLRAPDMDGLTNMRARLEKIGGRFAIASKAGRGTTLRFYLPLN